MGEGWCRERFSTPPVLSSAPASEEASDEESDGYQSGGSWNASELEEMSPIPTPTDPKLWHPRFQVRGRGLGPARWGLLRFAVTISGRAVRWSGGCVPQGLWLI